MKREIHPDSKGDCRPRDSSKLLELMLRECPHLYRQVWQFAWFFLSWIFWMKTLYDRRCFVFLNSHFNDITYNGQPEGFVRAKKEEMADCWGMHGIAYVRPQRLKRLKRGSPYLNTFGCEQSVGDPTITNEWKVSLCDICSSCWWNFIVLWQRKPNCGSKFYFKNQSEIPISSEMELLLEAIEKDPENCIKIRTVPMGGN